MAIIHQPGLFSWEQVDAASDMDRLRRVLEALPDEALMLALADQFDGLLYCCRELALGNRNALLVWRRQCAYIETITSTGEVPVNLALRASAMYEAIKEIYHETTSAGGPDFDVFSE